MKKLPLALALAALAAPALAQNNITLFGIMDVGLRSVANSGRDTARSIVSGNHATSRFGVRGQEDLGDGLFAGFHLEHGLAADTGSAVGTNQFWDRRSTVSLGHRRGGELRLGRDFVPTYTNWSRYDPFSYVGVAGANNLISGTPQGPIRAVFGSNANTTVRSSNALQYFLPADLGGLEGSLMAAAGEGGAVTAGQAKVLGGRLGWAAGAFGVSAAMTTTQNSQAGRDRFKDWAVGAHWNGSVVRLSAAWREFSFRDAKARYLLLGGVVPVGVGEFKLSYHQVEHAGRVGSTVIDGNDARQIGLGYVHHLSKRSALYGHLSRVDNDGQVSYAVPGGGGSPTPGGRSTGYEFGVRHSF